MNKKNKHGALKNKEAFKGTLKQWSPISQAMLQGDENIDCLCDYTLTFSNTLCFGEKEASWVVVFFFLFVSVFICNCVWFYVYACLDQIAARLRDTQPPRGKLEGGVRE